MSVADSLKAAFHAAYAEHFTPVLAALKFAPKKLKRVKPGLLVAAAGRSLDEHRRLEATLWCDGARGTNLRYRFDVIEPINGLECTGQVDLKVPWPDPAYPKPRSLDFSGQDFRPHESVERLTNAIAFLAGGFAASLAALKPVPELQSELDAAVASAAWVAAVQRAGALWETRFKG